MVQRMRKFNAELNPFMSNATTLVNPVLGKNKDPIFAKGKGKVFCKLLEGNISIK